MTTPRLDRHGNIILTCIAVSLVGIVTADEGEVDEPAQIVHYCMPHSETDLRLEGFTLELPIEEAELILPFGAPNVETILDNGPTANRIDLVWIGDGFPDR